MLLRIFLKSSLIVSNDSDNDRSLHLWFQLSITLSFLNESPSRVSLHFRTYFLLTSEIVVFYTRNDFVNGLGKDDARLTLEERQMNAVGTSVNVKTVQEEVTIRRTLGVAPTV